MDSPVNLVQRFYDSFSNLDYEGMNRLYSDDVQFFDPAFGYLQGEEVRCMWKMLCTRARNFSLTFEAPESLDHEYVTCRWKADYVFSASGRKVHNEVTAHMKMAEGRIIEHSDAFSMHRWAAQALGWKGWLLGGSGFFQRAVRKKARKQLERFMQENVIIQ